MALQATNNRSRGNLIVESGLPTTTVETSDRWRPGRKLTIFWTLIAIVAFSVSLVALLRQPSIETSIEMVSSDLKTLKGNLRNLDRRLTRDIREKASDSRVRSIDRRVYNVRNQADRLEEKVNTLKTENDLFSDDIDWIPVQKRVFDNRSTLFETAQWKDYRRGFGNGGGGGGGEKGESSFWLGLDRLHALTRRYESLRYAWTLKVAIRYDKYMTADRAIKEDDGRAGYWGVHEYGSFYVGSEEQNYRLSLGARFRDVNAGPMWLDMSALSGAFFSTIDRNNGPSNETNCAVKGGGGWWFGSGIERYPCGAICLNCDWRASNESYVWDGLVPAESRMWMRKTFRN